MAVGLGRHINQLLEDNRRLQQHNSSDSSFGVASLTKIQVEGRDHDYDPLEEGEERDELTDLNPPVMKSCVRFPHKMLCIVEDNHRTHAARKQVRWDPSVHDFGLLASASAPSLRLKARWDSHHGQKVVGIQTMRIPSRDSLVGGNDRSSAATRPLCSSRTIETSSSGMKNASWGSPPTTARTYKSTNKRMLEQLGLTATPPPKSSSKKPVVPKLPTRKLSGSHRWSLSRQYESDSMLSCPRRRS